MKFWISTLGLLIAILGPATPCLAQDEKPLIPESVYDEMLMWMVDGKYEKVLYKAIRYTEEEATSKEPRPYVFMAEAYFRISQSDDAVLKTKYPNALKDALKYAVKFRKKDKDDQFFAGYMEFINALRRVAMNEAEAMVDEEKFAKAKGMYKYLYDLDAEDAGAWIMYGTVLWKAKATRDAQEAWAVAEKLLTETGGKGLQPIQIDLLKYAIIYTAEQLDAVGDNAGAVRWVNLAGSLFEKDKEFMAVKKALNG
ncbi:MAG: hypothetical protein RJA19_1413 [Bacteroidota bacterium]|jgi:tetratricopeptide (TPR) repeat protein